MILEVFSIGLIIPVLSVIENKGFLKEILPNSNFIQNLSHVDQIYLTISVLCTVFIVKTFFVLFLNYQQNKYTTFLQAKISELLMFQYLNMPYKKYFKRNSSELLRNLKDECGSLIFWSCITYVKSNNRNISNYWYNRPFVCSNWYLIFFSNFFINGFCFSLYKIYKKNY